MKAYGEAPSLGEVEVTVFGPGYGEALAIHLGEGSWVLVDSCINPESGLPATSEYLDSLGVAPDKVIGIVATHWHDDHVRGISDLANKYPDAEFYISAALNSKEAMSFLAAYSGDIAKGLTKGTKELFRVLNDRSPTPLLSHSIVIEKTSGSSVRITAFSPGKEAWRNSIEAFSQYLPKKHEEQIIFAPDLSPNHESIVLHFDFGDSAVLMGSDLENHATLGWAAVLADVWCLTQRKASIYKVAHHGSYTGDDPRIWSSLLQEPIACLTPYNNGRTHLPQPADAIRIKSNTGQAFISSKASKKPRMDAFQRKRLEDICSNLSPVNTGFGSVRLRKSAGARSWRYELFGDAAPL